MKRSLLALPLALACVLAPGWMAAQDAKKEDKKEEKKADGKAPDKAEAGKLAGQARQLLKAYCFRCHGQTYEVPKVNVLDPKTLFVAANEDSEPWVVRGKSAKSPMWKRFATSMPPKSVKNIPRPNRDEREVIKKWIDAGAPEFPREERRRFVSTKETLEGMEAYLRGQPIGDRAYIRFFTLTNLHNDPRVPTPDLRNYRAAFSKALNSLSWKRTIVVPQAVDKDQTVYALDVRDLDWDRNHMWRAIMRAYPYGLSYAEHPDPAMQRLERDLGAMTKCELAYVRADWFVATATRPPLYHTLVKIPTNARLLEAKLGVDVIANFRRNRLGRAGFGKSGVSGQNRMVERHDAIYGAYWKSYDFKAKGKRDVLVEFPLGPRFRGNDYGEVAFEHDGGEIIFNLPNGLQGYMLIDGKDNRIDAGPEEVVNDTLKTSGTPAIVNGLSCMACHKDGMIPLPKDEIRTGAGVFGRARIKVQDLYPRQEVMDRWVARDSGQFLRALGEATIPLLFDKEEAKKERSIKELKELFKDEPVGDMARRYRLADLHLEDVALELGIEKPEVLAARIAGNRRMRILGMAALPTGGSIKRHDWETVGATSRFQRIARELEMGAPLNIVK
jgi:serine/threonine-protein kinase